MWELGLGLGKNVIVSDFWNFCFLEQKCYRIEARSNDTLFMILIWVSIPTLWFWSNLQFSYESNS